MKRIALVSLGCDKNLVDSEVALGKLVTHGYNVFSSLDDAHLVVLNTCAFIHEACVETENWIEKLVALKKKDPHKVLVVMGCYVQRFQNALSRKYPAIDYWIGVNDFPRLVEILGNGGHRSSSQVYVHAPLFLYDHKTERMLSTPSHYAYVKIAEGCNNRCSFCLIPSLRGPLRSRPWESVVEEVTHLLDMGIKEVILVAQDLTAYGLDLYGKRALPLLLRRVGEVLPTQSWLRLLYLSPYGLDRDLLETMATIPQIVKYLDVPLQHINAQILCRMNRRLTRQDIEERITLARTLLPRAFFRTTFMVGFPGEDENAFEELLEFVAQSRFERMGAFMYSDEPGTPAFSLTPKVDEEVKRVRYEQLMSLQKRIMKEVHRDLVGKTIEVIIDHKPLEEKGRKFVWGRTFGDAPDVDGVIKIWLDKNGDYLPGTIGTVKIIRSSAYQLEGEIV